MPNCVHCGTSTSRRDNQCPNCAFENKQFPSKGEETLAAFIEINRGKCVDCGYEKPKALVLLRDVDEKGNMAPTDPYRLERVLYEAAAHPKEWKIRCRNCQSRFNTSPGRPRTLTEEQREATRIKYSNSWATKNRLNEQVLDICGRHCVECGIPATRVFWVGEAGKGPKAGQMYASRKRIVNDPLYALNFNSFCPLHKTRYRRSGPRPYEVVSRTVRSIHKIPEFAI